MSTPFKKIVTVGVMNQPFGSWAIAAQSDDGITWDQVVQLPESRINQMAAATDGTSMAFANQRGHLCVTSDLQTFSTVMVDDGFGIVGMGYADDTWLAAGQKIYVEAYGPYGSNSEVAQIHRAASAGGPWEMVWSHPEPSSRVYQLKRFENAPITDSVTATVWVACGSNWRKADIWYSLDEGATWTQSQTPDNIRRILSVELVPVGGDVYWYWGSNGRIFRSPNLTSVDWSQVSVPERIGPVSDMLYHGSTLLISATSKILITQDGTYLRSFESPGYVFDKVARIDNDGGSLWMAFARSGLTQWTYWHSTDLNTWIPGNNGIHVSALVTYSPEDPNIE